MKWLSAWFHIDLITSFCVVNSFSIRSFVSNRVFFYNFTSVLIGIILNVYIFTCFIVKTSNVSISWISYKSRNVTWHCVNFVDNMSIFNPYVLYDKVAISRVPETGISSSNKTDHISVYWKARVQEWNLVEHHKIYLSICCKYH